VQILRGGRLDGHPALAELDDARSRAAVFAERSLLGRLGGGCLRPFGVWADAGRHAASPVSTAGQGSSGRTDSSLHGRPDGSCNARRPPGIHANADDTRQGTADAATRLREVRADGDDAGQGTAEAAVRLREVHAFLAPDDWREPAATGSAPGALHAAATETEIDLDALMLDAGFAEEELLHGMVTASVDRDTFPDAADDSAEDYGRKPAWQITGACVRR